MFSTPNTTNQSSSRPSPTQQSPTPQLGQHELLTMVDEVASGKLTRRSLIALASAIGAGHLVASQLNPLRRSLGLITPAEAAVTVEGAVPAGATGGGNLVVIYLGGGNDGLNTVVPVLDARYHELRPSIKLMPNEVLSLGTNVNVGLHPMLQNLQRRYLAGQVAVIQGVGYNAPDLSHFQSQDHWERGFGGLGSPVLPTVNGWLGRWADNAANRPFATVAFRSDDKTLVGASSAPLRLRPWASNLTGAPSSNAWDNLFLSAIRDLSARTGLGPLADRLSEQSTDAVAAGTIVGPAYSGISESSSGFDRQMLVGARLLNAGIGTRVIGAALGGFDTHSEQAIRNAGGAQHPFGWHGKLLAQLDAGLELLLTTMTPEVRANTTVLVYSEFGRRAGENGSAGTDHGAAGVSFVIGEGVNGGLFGEQPSLSAVDPDGNLRMGIDFRSIYATLLSRFMGANDYEILGASHERLLLSKADALYVPASSTSTSTTTSTTQPVTTQPVTTPPSTTAASVTTQPVTTQPVTTPPSTTAASVTTLAITTSTAAGTPTTLPATTVVPSTVVPSTVVSSTVVSSTVVSSTAASSTLVPSTAAPTTAASTTAASTTAAPTTAAPTTAAPTTAASTTAASTTAASTSTMPATTTSAPTTAAQTTLVPPTTSAATSTIKPTTTVSTSTTKVVPVFPPPVIVPPAPGPQKPAEQEVLVIVPTVPSAANQPPAQTGPELELVNNPIPTTRQSLPEVEFEAPAAETAASPPTTVQSRQNPTTTKQTTTLPDRLALTPVQESTKKSAKKPILKTPGLRKPVGNKSKKSAVKKSAARKVVPTSAAKRKASVSR